MKWPELRISRCSAKKRMAQTLVLKVNRWQACCDGFSVLVGRARLSEVGGDIRE